jgi:hypothetical protein
MAVRLDISVDFTASPRIITVEAPSTEINLQDLYDTLRAIEATAVGILYPALLSAAGKQVLGGGALVGMTLTLRNALLAFEARPGPTWVLCQVSGGNLVAVDSVGAPLSSPLQPTAYTYAVATQSTSASLLSGTGGLTKDDVQQAVLEAPVAGRPTNSLGYTVRRLREHWERPLVTAPGPVGNHVLYDRDGSTPLVTLDVSDAAGGPLVLPVGIPARRSGTGEDF